MKETPILIMHLSYLDDSGSDKKSPLVVVGAVVIEDRWIRDIESMCGVIVQNAIPEDKIREFKEFHAAELFHGFGVFEGIDKRVRYAALQAVLHQVQTRQIPCIYSAVNKSALANTAIGSAKSIDVAFRMCGLGVQRWLIEHDADNIAMFIFDDTDDRDLKRQLRDSFRELRPRFIPPRWSGPHRMFNIHDAMYFGPSTDSIGIQMADMCTYFIHQKIKGVIEAEPFFATISDYVICSKVEPEWSQYKGMFVEHANTLSKE